MVHKSPTGFIVIVESVSDEAIQSRRAGLASVPAAPTRAAYSPCAMNLSSMNFFARGTSSSDRCSMITGMFGCFSASRLR